MFNTPQEIDSFAPAQIRYSICSMVTNLEEYQEMVDSFKQAGFSDDICEFIYADNSGENKYEAYAGLNKMLHHAKGTYVILCHQDILLLYDQREKLDACIEELDQVDPQWAVLGNAGGRGFSKYVFRITEGDGKVLKRGKLPEQVHSIDENFMLLKRSANLGFSVDLAGFHLYGTDICMAARSRGYRAYVIDFHLMHKSGGTVNKSFFDLKKAFIKKYRQVLSPIFIQTTCTRIYVAGSWFKTSFFNWQPVSYTIKKVRRWTLKMGGNW